MYVHRLTRSRSTASHTAQMPLTWSATASVSCSGAPVYCAVWSTGAGMRGRTGSIRSALPGLAACSANAAMSASCAALVCLASMTRSHGATSHRASTAWPRGVRLVRTTYRSQSMLPARRGAVSSPRLKRMALVCAGCRQRRAAGVSLLPSPFGCRAFELRLARLQGDGLGGLAGSRAQRCVGRVLGEGDLPLTQVRDHVLSWLVPDVGPAPAAPSPSRFSGLPGEQQVQRGQVRHDDVLADVGVPRPLRAGRAGGGMPVAAPVGGPAVGPGRFHPPPARPAGQQPGQQVPPPFAGRRGRGVVPGGRPGVAGPVAYRAPGARRHCRRDATIGADSITQGNRISGWGPAGCRQGRVARRAEGGRGTAGT